MMSSGYSPVRVGLAAALAVVLVASPWWGRRALRALAFFHVREVRVIGARYTSTRDVVQALHLDPGSSVWDDERSRVARVNALGLVRHTEIDRELPGTLIVRITEATPVAMVSGASGMRVYDEAARVLPIDPVKTEVDLPVLERPDALLTRLLAGVRAAAPALFARISAVRRTSASELVVTLDTGIVLARADVTADRFAEVLPVVNDLTRRGARFTELDLRFRDQVVARVQ